MLIFTTVLQAASEDPFEMAELAGDCRLFQDLQTRSLKKAEELNSLLVKSQDHLKERKRLLDGCLKTGRSRAASRAPASEPKTSQWDVCSEEYRAWLQPLTRIQMLKQDLEAESHSTAFYRRQFHRNCK